MKITVLIIGLALAGIIGVQSFLILTSPFAPAALAGPASLGIIIGLLLIIGAAFAMSMLGVSMLCFAVAGVAALGAGLSTEFHDFRLWGAVALGLSILSYFANRDPKVATSAEPFVLGSYQRPPAGFVPSVETPITDRATNATVPDAAARPVAASLAPEATVVEQLERLSALRASGSLDDEEFTAMKAVVISQSTGGQK